MAVLLARVLGRGATRHFQMIANSFCLTRFLSIRESRRSQWLARVSKGLFCQGRVAPPSAVEDP
jgi:hypothetical protein